MTTLVQHADEILSHTFDFSALMAEGEEAVTVLGLTVERLDGGAADLTSAGLTASGREARVTLSGGTPGQTYQVTVRVTTSTGQTRVGQGLLKVVSRLP